jgi:hypothetical protein
MVCALTEYAVAVTSERLATAGPAAMDAGRGMSGTVIVAFRANCYSYPYRSTSSRRSPNICELSAAAAPTTRQRTHSFFQTIVQVVLDQGLLGLTDSLFDGVKLLGIVKTRTPPLIISTMLRRCPSARFRRLMISGCD